MNQSSESGCESGMSYRINRVVVIGSGTMGGGIAAHVANAGLPVYLLDIASTIVAASLDRLKRQELLAKFLDLFRFQIVLAEVAFLLIHQCFENFL